MSSMHVGVLWDCGMVMGRVLAGEMLAIYFCSMDLCIGIRLLGYQ